VNWKGRKPVTKTLSGKCFCGAVQYAVPDEFRYAMNCHCSNCRRTTGSAFKPFAGIEREKFAVPAGKDGLLIYGGDKAHDAHCKKCGSLLYSMSPWEPWSTRRPSGPAGTSSSAPRRPGSPSPTTCRSMRGIW
jgi:hypothetical protein